MSEQITPQPYGPPSGYGQSVEQPQPPKKKRVFLWFFLAVQALFIVWIIAGLASGNDTSNCGSLTTKTCNDAQNVGKGIGAAVIVIFWVVVDFLLALIYGVYRLAKRT